MSKSVWTVWFLLPVALCTVPWACAGSRQPASWRKWSSQHCHTRPLTQLITPYFIWPITDNPITLVGRLSHGCSLFYATTKEAYKSTALPPSPREIRPQPGPSHICVQYVLPHMQTTSCDPHSEKMVQGDWRGSEGVFSNTCVGGALWSSWEGHRQHHIHYH